MNPDYAYNDFDWSTTLQVWGPRILGAIAILLVAWVVGRALKWALARGVDRIPALANHNKTVDPKGTLGMRLGDVAYWLVLLIGIVAALSALQLSQVAAPLNTMLSNFFGYLPNVVGAALIFFIGFIVATLAKRVVTALLEAANLDRLLGKIGLTAVTGPGLAQAIGVLAFVLILIPVAIAALETLRIEAISGPAIAVLSTVMNAIPNVLAAAIVLAIGFLIGRWVASVVERILPATGFDKAVGALGAFSSKGKPDGAGLTDSTGAPMTQSQGAAVAGRVTPSKIAANLVLFAIVAFSAIEAARLLQFGSLAAILEDILGLAGRVIVGGVIITAGVLIADILSNAIDRSTSGADRFASTLVKWATIALSAAMGLRFMGIADEIVILAFGLILGSAALAAALAFGLGGREAAGRVASRWAAKAEAAGQSPDFGKEREDRPAAPPIVPPMM